MRIYIPTMGRTDKQKTVERLGLETNQMFSTTLVCPPGEVKDLIDRYGHLGIQVLPCKVKGIAATRQWILDFHRKSGSEHATVLMLDDDLPTWRKRTDAQNDRGETPYVKATTEDIRKGLNEFAQLMDRHAHGSIGHALFCQHSPPLKFNSRMLRALAYNVQLIPEKTKFRLPVMEDFDMELQLLTAGFPSVTYNCIVQDQHQNNSEGGCSSYRTNEVQAEAAHRLKQLWPAFTTVVTRAPKREWIGMGERTDVRVNWAAAARAGGIKS